VKGLQAPVVFLVDATGENDFGKHPVDLHVDRDEKRRAGRGRHKGYIALSKSKGEFATETIAYPDAWKGAGGLEKKEESFQVAEQLRLRYVASTRAGSALVVSVTARTSKMRRNEPVETGPSPRGNPWGHLFRISPGRACAMSRSCFRQKMRRGLLDAEACGGRWRLRSRGRGQRLGGRLLDMQKHSYETAAAKEYALSRAARLSVSETRPAVEGAAYPPSGEHGVEWGTIVHRLLELAPSTRDELKRVARDLLVEHDLDPASRPRRPTWSSP